MKQVPVLFLDLDGTVRHPLEGKKYINGPQDVVIYPEVPALLARYKGEGWRIVGVTNQGGVALGHVTLQHCEAAIGVTRYLCVNMFDAVMACYHHPDATSPLKAQCMCRKPKYGMLAHGLVWLTQDNPDEIYPLHLALMVGDMQTDEECARNAGVRFMWAEEWRKS